MDQPQPIPQPQITPPINFKRPFVLLLGLLGLAIIATSIFVGIKIGRNQVASIQPVINPSSTPIPPSTAPWQTYTSPDNLFSVTYPSDFKATTPMANGVLINNSLPADPNCRGGGCALGTQKLNLYFEVYPTTKNLLSFATERRDNSLNIDPSATPLTPVKFNGLDAYTYSSTGEGYNMNTILKINSTQGIVISENYPSQTNVGTYKSLAAEILATLKFLSPTPSPVTKSTNTFIPGKDWHRVNNTLLGLTFCLPPKWDFIKGSDNSFTGNLVYYRDSAYAPMAAYIQSFSTSNTSRREAYYKFWETEYPDIRERVTFSDVSINENSALLVSPANKETKESPEGLTVVWQAQGKMWRANISQWNYVNVSQSAFLKDFYTAISCTF